MRIEDRADAIANKIYFQLYTVTPVVVDEVFYVKCFYMFAKFADADAELALP